ncbi:hypothetical protein [Cupriavidus numazuensis]|uniref:Uncharacterized protein n=1 Tax=Cupriavidus numazuensis TaxID=221992 RepID=A0ABN7QCB0_9BURK|nr:hypothetical protein LMG26411_08163 [Cupriavidus numazuensis]
MPLLRRLMPRIVFDMGVLAVAINAWANIVPDIALVHLAVAHVRARRPFRPARRQALGRHVEHFLDDQMPRGTGLLAARPAVDRQDRRAVYLCGVGGSPCARR